MRQGGRYIVDKPGAKPRKAEGEEATVRSPAPATRAGDGQPAARPSGPARGSRKEN